MAAERARSSSLARAVKKSRRTAYTHVRYCTYMGVLSMHDAVDALVISCRLQPGYCAVFNRLVCAHACWRTLLARVIVEVRAASTYALRERARWTPSWSSLQLLACGTVSVSANACAPAGDSGRRREPHAGAGRSTVSTDDVALVGPVHVVSTRCPSP